MTTDKGITVRQDLGHIAEMLLLNGTLTECPGLVQGKMGIAVFFFHYARYTQTTLFADYALDVIGEMQKQLHASSRADYEKGIAGIGAGIDYLIRNDFLDATDDIFEDFDQRMIRAVLYDPWQDFSLYDGLTGYGRYWISRLRRQPSSVQAKNCLQYITERIEEHFPDISAEVQSDVYCFLHELHETPGMNVSVDLLEQCRKQAIESNRSFFRLGDSAVSNYIRMYQRNRYFNEPLQGETDAILKQLPAMDREKPPAGMGLLGGYAGEGLLRMAATGQTNNAWMSLL